jgi:hypothetical protein
MKGLDPRRSIDQSGGWSVRKSESVGQSVSQSVTVAMEVERVALRTRHWASTRFQGRVARLNLGRQILIGRSVSHGARLGARGPITNFSFPFPFESLQKLAAGTAAGFPQKRESLGGFRRVSIALLPTILEHHHPSETELKIGCRVVNVVADITLQF